jgi:biopolymer transport protein ExbD
MAISFGAEDEDEVMASINTTPLVDIMLVLLIIFLITIPVVIHTVPVQLPRERNQPTQTKPENIDITVNKEGRIYWNRQRVLNTDALFERLKSIAVLSPQPEIHIRGDQNAHYEPIGEVVFACQRAGIRKLGFITEPPAPGG